jgi:hypothetical protein
MNNSSAPTGYSTTSNDTITITGIDSIDLSSINTSASMSYPYYTNSNGSLGSISISSGLTIGSTIPSLTTSQINSISIDTSTFKFNVPEDWIDQFPDWRKVEKMCKEYPGLQIAFEKFKTTYKLVVDHYDTPKDKRPKP